MAITRVTSGQRFHCLKADTKPTTGVQTGARLLETDTGSTWEYNGAAWVPVLPSVDSTTLAMHTVDHATVGIQEGHAFSAYYTRTTDATATHRSGIYMLTPATPYFSMVVSFSASVAAVFAICEAPTFTANIGTHGVAVFNRRRVAGSGNSTCIDNATAAAANKITTLNETEFAAGSFAAGTVLRTGPLQVGVGPKPAGGASRDTQEYILKPATKYIFMLTNTPDTANVQHILLDWHEHTER